MRLSNVHIRLSYDPTRLQDGPIRLSDRSDGPIMLSDSIVNLSDVPMIRL
jgi:hypothetical protein